MKRIYAMEYSNIMKRFSVILPFVIAFLLAVPGSGIAHKAALDVNAGGTTKGGDVPVIPGLTDDPQIAAGNGGKVGEVPVVTG